MQVSVYPTLVPNSHVLASVNGVFNAVFVRRPALDRGDADALADLQDRRQVGGRRCRLGMRANERFTVALIGASGLLGRAIAGELASAAGAKEWRIVRTAHSRAGAQNVKLDLLDHDAVRAFLRELLPDAIVVAAAERRSAWQRASGRKAPKVRSWRGS